MNVKYMVVEVSLPEWCTGQFDSCGIYEEVQDAFDMAEALESKNKNDDAFYSVVVIKDE